MGRPAVLSQMLRAPAAINPAEAEVWLEGIDPRCSRAVFRGLHRYGMPRSQCCQIGNDRMFGKLRLDRHQPTRTSEGQRLADDPLTELPIGDGPLPGKDQRRPVAPFRQIRNERDGHP